MPTYEYICESCGHKFEKFQSITASPVRKCPRCGKVKLKRLMGTGAGIIFKGSGFYETDYRSESYKKARANETTSTDKTDKTGGDKTGTADKTASPKTESKKPTDKNTTKPSE